MLAGTAVGGSGLSVAVAFSAIEVSVSAPLASCKMANWVKSCEGVGVIVGLNSVGVGVSVSDGVSVGEGVAVQAAAVCVRARLAALMVEVPAICASTVKFSRTT